MLCLVALLIRFHFRFTAAIKNSDGIARCLAISFAAAFRISAGLSSHTKIVTIVRIKSPKSNAANLSSSMNAFGSVSANIQRELDVMRIVLGFCVFLSLYLFVGPVPKSF